MDSTTYDLMADDASTIYGPRLPLEPWRMEGQDQWMDPWTGWLTVGGKVGDEWWTVDCVGGFIGGRWTVDGGRWAMDSGQWAGVRWTVAAKDGICLWDNVRLFTYTVIQGIFLCLFFVFLRLYHEYINLFLPHSEHKAAQKERPKKNHPKTVNPPRRAMSPTESYTDARSNAPSGVAKVRH